MHSTMVSCYGHPLLAVIPFIETRQDSTSQTSQHYCIRSSVELFPSHLSQIGFLSNSLFHIIKKLCPDMLKFPFKNTISRIGRCPVNFEP
ncbi:hypothetical protein SAMN05192566_0779 [Methylophilus rhizosphaerae]|uniref:Uncharacterized protein n=1 Tax=Methylophilus rhizosphaerae TaxID=492660 RepID=A0A1G9AT00_9PROT|nr:hypothetical protein SAMN05192566_0779 [Methylophilus rhizosphaerae]